MIFDSGDDFEQITAAEYPDDFNSGNEENDDFEGRSDNKGPEPEAIEVATIGDKVYAFIGLERIGGVMMYDITDPANATFMTYINNRDFSVMDPETNAIGDLGCEDVLFIDSASSANGNYYIVTSNEVSGTVSVFQINGVVGTKNIENAEQWSLYPNPANGVIRLSEKGNYRITDLSGRVMGNVSNANTIDVSSYNAGVYFISNQDGETKSFIKN